MTTGHNVADALERSGYGAGPDFDRAYANEPWVYNLANALAALYVERDEAVTLLRRAGDVIDDLGIDAFLDRAGR